MTTWKLRRATSDDLPRIYALETLGFPLGIVEEKSVFEKRIQAFPEGFFVFYCQVANVENIVGYFCCEIWGPGPVVEEAFHLGHDISAFLNPIGTTLYIASLTIDPTWRGKGLADKMFELGLKEMKVQFPKLEKALLLVNVHWKSAIGIYKRHGFQITSTLQGFFKPSETTEPEDGVIMENHRLKDW